MMRKRIVLLVLPFVAFFMFVLPFAPVGVTQDVAAQGEGDANLLCQIFPFLEGIRFTAGLCGGDINDNEQGVITVAFQIGELVVSLIFIGIIAVAIFFIIKSALKYIQSEGDETKVEEATKAIKNVFIGIGALIVGIIGLVIILAIFNAGSGLNPDQTNPEEQIRNILEGS